MRRVLSILLTVIIVLAPCVVVHAASASSDTHVMDASDQSRSQHADCYAGQQGNGHSACPGDCDTTQRTAAASAPERSVSDSKSVYPAIVFAVSLVLASLIDESAPGIGTDRLVLFFDSKSVLRQTARLRL